MSYITVSRLKKQKPYKKSTGPTIFLDNNLNSKINKTVVKIKLR